MMDPDERKDGQTPDDAYTISSTGEPTAKVSLQSLLCKV